ncbi:MAG: hypothetical protein WAK93_00920, partial [Solirubrobacteraceae bacterium]
MSRACLTARVAALVAVCAVGAPVARATAPAAMYRHATTTTAESVARVTVDNAGPGAVSGIESGASGATVRTPASQRATIRAGGAAAVAATSTAQGFLGIATELDTIPALSGAASDPDTPFLHLLSNLSPGAPPLLRLGGNSADDSWWRVPGMKKPPYLYTLTPRWASDVRALLTALGGKAVLGLDLKAPPEIDSKIATAEVADFNRYVGVRLIEAFELGNEPEFYP